MNMTDEEGSAARDWLAERLFARRTVMLSGHLDASAANRAAGQLMLLDADGDDPVQVHLTDVDADLDAVLTMLDVIDVMGVPVHVSVAGAVRGPAVALLAAGDRRVLRPNATVELAEPRTTVAEGRASDIAAAAAEHARRLRHLQERVAEACGRPLEDVVRDMRTGRFLDAAAARAYGLGTDS